MLKTRFSIEGESGNISFRTIESPVIPPKLKLSGNLKKCVPKAKSIDAIVRIKKRVLFHNSPRYIISYLCKNRRVNKILNNK